MKNTGKVKSRARGLIADQVNFRTTNLGETLGENVPKLRAMGDSLREQGLNSTAGYIDYAADHLDAVSSYLTQTDGDQMIHDLETVARKQTLLVSAIGIIAGLTAARLLKAASNQSES